MIWRELGVELLKVGQPPDAVKAFHMALRKLMEVADSGGVIYAADQEGGFIFPEFLHSFARAFTVN